MAQVDLAINGRHYAVGCEDGQEPHIRELAQVLDRHVRAVARQVGSASEARLFLMAGLLVADELNDARARLAQIQGEMARVQSDLARSEHRATAALEAAAERLEKLAGG